MFISGLEEEDEVSLEKQEKQHEVSAPYLEPIGSVKYAPGTQVLSIGRQWMIGGPTTGERFDLAALAKQEMRRLGIDSGVYLSFRNLTYVVQNTGTYPFGLMHRTRALNMHFFASLGTCQYYVGYGQTSDPLHVSIQDC